MEVVILTELNAAQRDAVTSLSKHLLVLAGAGSGKTRVLVYRIAWLIEQQGVPLRSIMAVTFTNKAAAEMRHRLEKTLNLSSGKFWVGTFHGIAHRILRQHWQEAGLAENFQIIDGDDQMRLVRRIVRNLNLDEEVYEPKRIQGYINRHKDEGRRAGQLPPQFDKEQAMFAQIYLLYEQHCQRASILDFAELLIRAYELWVKKPEVLAYYQQRFTHVLVDEFQDTNSIQYLWLQQLIGPNGSSTVVGDDDQSIYGWRGAKIENIHRYTQDYAAAGTQTIRLEQNYRSTRTILCAANALISQNQGRLGKQLWTDGNEGEQIGLYCAYNEVDEARFVVEQIQQWRRKGKAYKDAAILYRSNAQSRVIEQALCHEKVPYRIYGGLRFFERAEIKDIMAYLRLIMNPLDDPAFERVINVPARGIGERTLVSVREMANAQKLPLWEAAMLYEKENAAGRAGKGFRSFFNLIDALANTTMPLPELVQALLERSGMIEAISSQPGERSQTRLENLQEMVTATQHFCESFNAERSSIQINDFDSPNEVNKNDYRAALSAFLAEAALDSGPEEGSIDDDCVKLMTLHSAKGLEFSLVFLVGLEDGLFPHHRCTLAPKELEEERRLCYVGITRAMEQLYLSYAERRAFAGSSGTKRPSRFIDEIPSELIARLNVRHVASTPRRAELQSGAALGSDIPFKLGQRVAHKRFGKGIVIGGEGHGEMARVQINFDDQGTKWLVLSYANLQPLQEA